MKKFMLLSALIGILAVSCTALAVAVPKSYVITYVSKYVGMDSTVDNYYVLDNRKVRRDVISEVKPSTILIYRQDQDRILTLIPKSKRYTIEIAQQSDLDYYNIEHPGFVESIESLGEKIGWTRYLGFRCDVYQRTDSAYTEISLVAHRYNILLKSLEFDRNRIINRMEATEFRIKRPSATLFEVPKGYRYIGEE